MRVPRIVSRETTNPGSLVKSARTTQLNSNAPSTTTSFFLRSSLLGGVVVEYDSAGIKQNAYVFAGGEILAQQQRMGDGTTRLMWQYLNPLTGDGLNTDSQGLALDRTTVDPMGVNTGDTDPFVSEGGGSSGGEGMSQSAIDAMVAALIPGFGGPKCKVDGMITGCRLAFGALSSGAAVLLNPGANTTPRIVIYQGKSVLATYRATYDGYQGYIPVNANYTGNGNFTPVSSGPPTLRTDTLHDTNFALLNGATGEAQLGRSPQNTLTDVGLQEKEGEHLNFNGCRLVYYDDNGNEVRSWQAVSGLPGTSREDQFKYGIGPIPEGTYTVDPSQSTYRFDGKVVNNPFSAIPPAVFIPSHPVWYNDDGLGRAWGNYRTPIIGPNAPGRTGGYFLHGGSTPGSAGCIDMTSDNDAFHKWFRSHGRKLTLHVKLECNPWNKK